MDGKDQAGAFGLFAAKRAEDSDSGGGEPLLSAGASADVPAGGDFGGGGGIGCDGWV